MRRYSMYQRRSCQPGLNAEAHRGRTGTGADRACDAAMQVIAPVRFSRISLRQSWNEVAWRRVATALRKFRCQRVADYVDAIKVMDARRLVQTPTQRVQRWRMRRYCQQSGLAQFRGAAGHHHSPCAGKPVQCMAPARLAFVLPVGNTRDEFARGPIAVPAWGSTVTEATVYIDYAVLRFPGRIVEPTPAAPGRHKDGSRSTIVVG